MWEVSHLNDALLIALIISHAALVGGASFRYPHVHTEARTSSSDQPRVCGQRYLLPHCFDKVAMQLQVHGVGLRV